MGIAWQKQIGSGTREHAGSAVRDWQGVAAAPVALGTRTMVGIGAVPEEELIEYREIFNLVDDDGSGEIGKDEIAQLMHMIGLSITDEQLDQMIEEIDEDGSGEMGFDVFVLVMRNSSKPEFTKEDVKRCMKEFGGSDQPPGCASLKSLEENLSLFHRNKDEVDAAMKMLAGADDDGNGAINFDEYVDMMMSDN